MRHMPHHEYVLWQHLKWGIFYPCDSGPLLPPCSEVSLGEVRAALQSLDPGKPTQELYALLARGFSVLPEQVGEASDASVPLAQLKERLQAGVMKRTAPRQ